MKFNYSKKIIIISLILIISGLLCVNPISAHDVGNETTPVLDSTNDINTDFNSKLELNDNNIDSELRSDDAGKNIKSNSENDEIGKSNRNNAIKDPNDDAYEKLVNDIKNNAGETIYLNTDIVMKKKININKNLTIDGNNHILDGNSSIRIFNVTSGTVTFKNIIFQHANKNSGCAIYNSGTLIIDNCQFINNTATIRGAAICNNDTGILTITNSKFTGNTALNNSNNSNGAAIYNRGSLNVDNCQFDNNVAYYRGAAIYSKLGNLNVVNSKFSNNYVTSGSGGAIFTLVTSVIQNCVFEDNYAESSNEIRGGAVHCDAESKIISCTFIGNKAKSSTKSHGGAIYCNANSEITDCIFTGNKGESSTTSYGGAVYLSKGTYTLNRCTFSNNEVANHGGAIFIYKNADSVTINNCEFKNNKASKEDGGAISSAAKKLMIINSKFTGNYAYEDGGAVDTYSDDGKIITVNIENSIFESNTGRKSAGAIYLGTKTSQNIKNSQFKNNKASVAGALYVEDQYASIDNCVFTGNSATKITTVYDKNNKVVKQCGGAIYNKGAYVKITNSNFNGNSASDGGALFNKGTMDVYYNTITNNNAEDCGGAYNEAGTMNVYYNTITYNKAKYGGALLNKKTLNAYYNKINYNTATYGGAIYARGTTNAYHNTISYNKATYGGAVYTDQNTASVYYNTIKYNTAKYGGAIYNRATTKAYYNTISYNKATYGGGFYNSYGTCTVMGNIFRSNTAKYGGGIMFNSGTAKIKGNAFLYNKGKYSDVYSKKKINLNNNWWRHTKSNLKKSPKKLKLTNMDVTSWLYLKVVASPSKIKKGKKSTVKIYLKYTNKNKVYKLPTKMKIPITLTATYGTLNKYKTNISKGIASVKFKKTAKKTSKITIKVLGVKYSIKI